MTIADVVKALDQAASAVNRHPPCEHRDGAGSCLTRERARGFRGNRLRPTASQDPKRMCTACAAAWHVAMAQVLVDELARAGVA